MATRHKSPLASFEKISPNKTSPRRGKVRRLIPHCVAGNLTAEAILGLSNFQKYDSVKGASCTYAIGSNGKIGLGVSETDRAWTSSNSTADHEAITFEIANNGGAPNWSMSDEAINAWLDLSVEIAKFYGFKKIAYYGNKNDTGKPDEMIIQLHRWFAAKACPGDYFVSKIPWLVTEMNKRLNGGAPVKFSSGVVAVQPQQPLQPAPTTSANTSYRIKITASALNVRKGPGTNYGTVQTLRNDKNIYTITQESNGAGAKKWGKLKSGIGWISLDYTKKV